MSSPQTTYLSSNKTRALFSKALSEMYQEEVPQYVKLSQLLRRLNDKNPASQIYDKAHLNTVYHGAIRLGKAFELFAMRRLFAVMGMQAVDYYDLSSAGIPVHSTAFRAVKVKDLSSNPFRMFCSLLRLECIEDNGLREKAEKILASRNLFSADLMQTIKQFEQQGGLTKSQAKLFVEQALAVFRRHEKARVDQAAYQTFAKSSRILADIACFETPHMNHLTLRTLDIEAAQFGMIKEKFKAKENIEGPPKRAQPILLRQTSFMAIEEKVVFTDDRQGIHAARFAEIEQRGAALTPKGRALYDALLIEARTKENQKKQASSLDKAFEKFPDSKQALFEQGLAYFTFKAKQPPEKNAIDLKKKANVLQLIRQGHLQISPIIYEDFLPVSAAGIFQSNLQKQSLNKLKHKQHLNPIFNQAQGQRQFEQALGTPVLSGFSLYEKQQQKSLKKALTTLGFCC